MKDKVIVVTGASSGIGKITAIHLSQKGAKCILIGRNIERLKEVQSNCINETLIICKDLVDFDSYDEIFETIFNKFGKIDGFIHSAGIEQTILIQQLNVSKLNDIFKINVFSAIEFIKRLMKKKYKAENQSYIIISSVMGVVGNKGLVSYSASKGAVISMVKSMALELASRGIRVNCISPGHLKDSEMSVNKEANLSLEANEIIKNNHPLGLGKCMDVASLSEFLLSENSSWITGQNIIIDGGYSIQ